MARQVKLDNRQLINHLSDKGVTFHKTTKGQAITFLDKNNYYYSHLVLK